MYVSTIYVKLKSRLSARLTVTSISQPCLQLLKWGFLKMKAESSGTSKYIFVSLNVPVFIHTSALSQWCKLKQPLHCKSFCSVGNATDFNTKGPKKVPKRSQVLSCTGESQCFSITFLS